MASSSIQFQKCLSLPDFQTMCGTEQQCEAALELSRHLSVNDDIARPLHNKILRAMTEREGSLSGAS